MVLFSGRKCRVVHRWSHQMVQYDLGHLMSFVLVSLRVPCPFDNHFSRFSWYPSVIMNRNEFTNQYPSCSTLCLQRFGAIIYRELSQEFNTNSWTIFLRMRTTSACIIIFYITTTPLDWNARYSTTIAEGWRLFLVNIHSHDLYYILYHDLRLATKCC